jgi:nitroimidazol reductase NimA-like FMN-containing flavoprotein (pyridoxamine 5'-phosphate oxidase superfamily)
MSTDPYAQWMGAEMATEDVDALLTAAEHGVLAVAEDDVPYTIPVSFGYEDGDIYFAFVKDSADNEKFRFIADGKPARLLVTDIKARFDWRSVAVTGPVEAIDVGHDGWATLVDSLENNPWFSTAFENDERVEGVRGWRLTPDEVSGLEINPVEG